MDKTALNKIQSNLPDNIDAALISNSANKRYFTGVNTDDAGTLVVCKEKAFFIIDSRYYEMVNSCISKDFIVILQDDLFSQINKLFSENNVKSYCIEKQYTTITAFEKIKSALSKYTLNNDYELYDYIIELRSIKNDNELDYIKKAQSITEEGFDYILGKISHNKTEKELALELEYFLRKNGANKLSFDTIFVSGKNSSLPHGTPGNKKIEIGDFITIDFGVEYNGYMSDMTRTVVYGKASEEQIKVYNTVLEAQNAAFSLIKEGIECYNIDKAARDVISNAGYGKYFGHALGHSVGLEIHESPNFSPKCDTVLKEGMILTVEPGIYIPDKFGVRIEDMVYVTKNGYKNLTKSDKSLIIL